VTARSLASAASASSVRRSEPSLSSAKEDPTADAGALSPDLADPPARDREALEAAFFFLASETMVEKKRRGEKEVGRAHKNERRRPWVLFLRVGGWGLGSDQTPARDACAIARVWASACACGV